MRDDFTESTKRVLAERVNYLCSNPSCRTMTSGPNSNISKSTKIGVAAHITAASPNGPRFESKLNKDERRLADNGIWLCYSCSVLIDRDQSKFSVSKLKNWKELTEDFVNNQIVTNAINRSTTTEECRKLLTSLNSSKPISEYISDIFIYAVVNGKEELREIATREINGYYSSELPELNEDNSPTYRIRDVYFGPQNLEIIKNFALSLELVTIALENHEYVCKGRFLFPEPIREIEEQLSRSGNLFHRNIDKNQLTVRGKQVGEKLSLWYFENDVRGIHRDIKRKLTRVLIGSLSNQE